MPLTLTPSQALFLNTLAFHTPTYVRNNVDESVLDVLRKSLNRQTPQEMILQDADIPATHQLLQEISLNSQNGTHREALSLLKDIKEISLKKPFAVQMMTPSPSTSPWQTILKTDGQDTDWSNSLAEPVVKSKKWSNFSVYLGATPKPSRKNGDVCQDFGVVYENGAGEISLMILDGVSGSIHGENAAREAGNLLLELLEEFEGDVEKSVREINYCLWRKNAFSLLNPSTPKEREDVLKLLKNPGSNQDWETRYENWFQRHPHKSIPFSTTIGAAIKLSPSGDPEWPLSFHGAFVGDTFCICFIEENGEWKRTYRSPWVDGAHAQLGAFPGLSQLTLKDTKEGSFFSEYSSLPLPDDYRSLLMSVGTPLPLPPKGLMLLGSDGALATMLEQEIPLLLKGLAPEEMVPFLIKENRRRMKKYRELGEKLQITPDMICNVRSYDPETRREVITQTSMILFADPNNIYPGPLHLYENGQMRPYQPGETIYMARSGFLFPGRLVKSLTTFEETEFMGLLGEDDAIYAALPINF